MYLPLYPARACQFWDRFADYITQRPATRESDVEGWEVNSVHVTQKLTCFLQRYQSCSYLTGPIKWLAAMQMERFSRYLSPTSFPKPDTKSARSPHSIICLYSMSNFDNPQPLPLYFYAMPPTATTSKFLTTRIIISPHSLPSPRCLPFLPALSPHPRQKACQ
jgi:hypothetical protein